MYHFPFSHFFARFTVIKKLSFCEGDVSPPPPFSKSFAFFANVGFLFYFFLKSGDPRVSAILYKESAFFRGSPQKGLSIVEAILIIYPSWEKVAKVRKCTFSISNNTFPHFCHLSTIMNSYGILPFSETKYT